MPYIASLQQYIYDALKINTTTMADINSIKKLTINIDAILAKFRSSVSMKILLERSKLLLVEKYNIIKEDQKKILKEKKADGRATCTIGKSGIKLDDMRKEIEASLKKKENIEIEKGMWERKAKTFKKVGGNISSPSKSSCISSSDSEYDNKNKNNNSSRNTVDSANKGSYREFARLVLKTKFERLNSKSPGQEVQEKILWNEVNKQKVPVELWESFILKELQDYKKYISTTPKSRVTKCYK